MKGLFTALVSVGRWVHQVVALCLAPAQREVVQFIEPARAWRSTISARHGKEMSPVEQGAAEKERKSRFRSSVNPVGCADRLSSQPDRSLRESTEGICIADHPMWIESETDRRRPTASS